MVIRLVAHGHTFLHKPSAAFGIDADPRRVTWWNGIALEYPAHVMEQCGCCQHDRRIPELVKAVEKKSCIRIALCRGSNQPFSGLLTIRRNIPPKEIQLAQGVLCKLISLIGRGCQVCKRLFRIFWHGLADKINLSEPIPCKLAAMVCGLVQPFQSFYTIFK